MASSGHTLCSVDAIADIAEAYPLSVFPKAVGLGQEGVENLLPYGAMVFNAFGPRNAHAREALSPTGLGALGCGRHRRDHGGGGAAAGALAALGVDLMSAVGTKRTSRHDQPMFAFGGKADIPLAHLDVRSSPRCPLMTSGRKCLFGPDSQLRANAVNAANAMTRPVALRSVRCSRRINIPSRAAITSGRANEVFE